jgi:UDP-N-acetylmuramyl pentapeptide phosphotransferase/UDP-N-acetylglucosamine-1-phosphate transferase
MIWAGALLLAALSFAASLAGTRVVLAAALSRRMLLDRPNERSSHLVPTPRGAGLAVLPVLLLGWLAIALVFPGADSAGRIYWVLGAALLLGLVSWRDDLASLPASLRILCHIAAVGIGLFALDGQGSVSQGLLPPLADRLLAGLAWLWFVNLFNFMDGIDGIAGCETATLGLGVALVALAAGLGSAMALYGLAAAAAALGFLWWNWPPGRIFLGDVGSVPLGYLLGWLLLLLAARGEWAAALILPAYYLADASLTLLARLARGERIWQAHRQHFYQRAVQAGLGHAQVVGALLRLNMLLLALALWSSRAAPWPPLLIAGLATALLLGYFGSRKPLAAGG